jgi:hypothetical protein
MSKPPKNRDFLGFVKHYNNEPYWDIFFWATREDGVRKACFVDRQLCVMPDLIRWADLPNSGEDNE